jgi:hypothetical protein
MDIRPVQRQAPPARPIVAPVRPTPVNPIAASTHAASSPVAQPAPVAAPPRPPAPASAPTPIRDSFTPEIVDSIPVKQPGLVAAPPANAPTPQTQSQLRPAGQEDELDQILQAVNNRVKTPQPVTKASKPLPKPKMPSIFKGTRNYAVAVAAILIAGALSAAAVFAYRQSAHAVANKPGQVGTTSTASSAVQSAGGVLIRPSDLDDYSQDLQTKLNNLNDNQDFENNSLSDKMLGL